MTHCGSFSNLCTKCDNIFSVFYEVWQCKKWWENHWLCNILFINIFCQIDFLFATFFSLQIVVASIVSLGCVFSLVFHVTVREKNTSVPGYEPLASHDSEDLEPEVSATVPASTSSHHYTTTRQHMRPKDWFKVKQVTAIDCCKVQIIYYHCLMWFNVRLSINLFKILQSMYCTITLVIYVKC